MFGSYNPKGVSDLSERAEFKGKEKANLSAEQGYEFINYGLKKQLEILYCTAEFAFGTNPCGDIHLATEKAYGTCMLQSDKPLGLAAKTNALSIETS